MNTEKDYIPEKDIKGHSKSISIESMALLIEYTKKRICKISINSGGKGTGFFCIIPLDDWENLRVLMTNNHVLGEKDIAIGKKIKFTLDNDREEKEIIIDDGRRKYSSEKYDVTIIEIRKNDGIKNDSFFEIDNKIFDDYKIYIKQSIYLLHYPKGKEMSFSNEIIHSIYEDKYTIQHLCDSNVGSSGGPLINTINYKVIGIHKGGAKGNKQYNLGTLLKEPLEEFISKINKKEKKEEVNNEEIEKNKNMEQKNKNMEEKQEIKSLNNNNIIKNEKLMIPENNKTKTKQNVNNYEDLDYSKLKLITKIPQYGFNIIELQDGRIAFLDGKFKEDQFLYIFNLKKNNNNCDIKYNLNTKDSEHIKIFLLEDGNIIIYSDDSIRLIKILEKNIEILKSITVDLRVLYIDKLIME